MKDVANLKLSKYQIGRLNCDTIRNYHEKDVEKTLNGHAVVF